MFLYKYIFYIFKIFYFCFNILRFYWKYLNITCHSFHNRYEKRNLYALINLPFNVKSVNAIQKYSHMSESYSINISYNIFISYEFLNFFWNMFSSMQSNPVSSYWLILIKIHYTCPILLSFILGKLFLE